MTRVSFLIPSVLFRALICVLAFCASATPSLAQTKVKLTQWDIYAATAAKAGGPTENPASIVLDAAGVAVTCLGSSGQ